MRLAEASGETTCMLCAGMHYTSPLDHQNQCSWKARLPGCASGGVRMDPAELACCRDATYGRDRAVDTERTWLPERPGRTVALGGTAETWRAEARDPRRAVTFGGSRCIGDVAVDAAEDAVEL